MMRWKRERFVPSRDSIMVLTCDEETAATGGHPLVARGSGLGWRTADYALNTRRRRRGTAALRDAWPSRCRPPRSSTSPSRSPPGTKAGTRRCRGPTTPSTRWRPRSAASRRTASRCSTTPCRRRRSRGPRQSSRGRCADDLARRRPRRDQRTGHRSAVRPSVRQQRSPHHVRGHDAVGRSRRECPAAVGHRHGKLPRVPGRVGGRGEAGARVRRCRPDHHRIHRLTRWCPAPPRPCATTCCRDREGGRGLLEGRDGRSQHVGRRDRRAVPAQHRRPGLRARAASRFARRTNARTASTSACRCARSTSRASSGTDS